MIHFKRIKKQKRKEGKMKMKTKERIFLLVNIIAYISLIATMFYIPCVENKQTQQTLGILVLAMCIIFVFISVLSFPSISILSKYHILLRGKD
jgi:glucan phosphoethanolaminetransferase (alkaline phosphatase superfamily)